MKLRCIIVLCIAISGCSRGPTEVEQLLGQIHTIPFKSTDRGTDPAYGALLAKGFAISDELVKQIGNTSPSVDPRKAPIVTENYVMGDTALFCLSDVLKVPFEDFLPRDVVSNMQSSGMSAYFAYVRLPQGRADVQARASRLVSEKRSRTP